MDRFGVLAAIATSTIIALVWLRNIFPSLVDFNQPRKATDTFRVRGVPLEWDNDRLRSFLTDQTNSAGPCIWSLTREVKGVTQTATVTFRGVPPSLQTINACKLRLPGESTRPRFITLDDGFLGLTTLYSPPLEDHKVE